MNASDDSPKMAARITAIANSSTNGLRNCRSNIRNSLLNLVSGLSDLSLSLFRFEACSAVRPSAEDCSSIYNCSIGNEEMGKLSILFMCNENRGLMLFYGFCNKAFMKQTI